jgi:hypothetical protein
MVERRAVALLAPAIHDGRAAAVGTPPQVRVEIRLVGRDRGTVAAILRGVRAAHVLHPREPAVVAGRGARDPHVVAIDVGAGDAVEDAARGAGQSLAFIRVAHVDRAGLAVVADGGAIRGEHRVRGGRGLAVHGEREKARDQRHGGERRQWTHGGRTMKRFDPDARRAGAARLERNSPARDTSTLP